MFKKTRILILAAVTMTVMLLGSMAVFAAVNNSADEPTITKNVTIAEGVTLDNTTVTFQVKQVANADGLTAPATVATYTTDGTVSSTATEVNNIVLNLAAKIDDTKPGEYTFEVSETAPTSNDNWTIDTTVYLVQVLVKNDKTVTYSVTKKGETPATKTELTFTNAYKATTDLSVSKAVTSDANVDKDTEYEFTITFTAGGDTAPVPSKISGKIGDGEATDYTVTDSKATFKLKKGQTITFSGLPAGLKYTVTETKPTPSTVEYVDTDVAQTIDGNEQTSTKGLASKTNAVLGNKGANTVGFTNNYKEISPTGIITHYLPYIAVILLAIVAFALFIVSRRRKAARY